MEKSKDKTNSELRSIRDTVESVGIAVILAFVLRAFIVEAFVIPTGSMAPRLLGEHWSLTCPSCGYEFAYGVPGAARSDPRFDRKRRQTPAGALCPNCGYKYPAAMLPDYPRGGDRVLVMKYLYRFSEPKCWDVAVFRNPQNNRENYIKRVVGVPGETIEVVHGDIFVRTDGIHWKIRSKPASAQKEMWQVIYNNDYRPNLETHRKLDKTGIQPPSWVARGNGWDLAAQDGRQYRFAGGSESEIKFAGQRDLFLPHYGYNLPTEEARHIDDRMDICSDLKLSLVFLPGGPQGGVSLSLSSFKHRFRAELSVDGTVRLLHDPPDGVEGNWQQWSQTQLEPLERHKAYSVALSHADFQVVCWVDGKAVLTSSVDDYQADYDWLKARLAQVDSEPIPTPEVAISAWGGQCELRHVSLSRDAFYTCPYVQRIEPGPLWDFARRLRREGQTFNRGWGTRGNPITLRKFDGHPELDQFFVLGDNSPQSLDGRGWTKASPTLRLYDDSGNRQYQLGTVPRYNMIGKAFFVYWPAGFSVPGLPGLPIIPNVGRMRLIR